MNVYAQIARNKRRSVLLIICLMAFVALITYFLGSIYSYSPLGWLGISLVVTGLYSLISYYYSDRMVLAISGAKQVTKAEAVELYSLVENLCIGLGLPMPKVYVMDDSSPNAFATGRDPQHAAVCFTTGILQKLDRQELEGVAAHELSHVKNYDTRMTTLAVILVGVVALLSDFLLRLTMWGGMTRDRDNRSSNGILAVIGLALAIIAPIVATLMQLALSRQREYLADASAAYLTRYPEGLARALEKISTDAEPLEAANNATASLYFTNPLKAGAAGWFSGLFDTHPPITERISRLRSM